jgi:hypothetical protein
MDLELATLYDISEELSKRGLQFVIFIEKTKINDGHGELEVCVDANKDLQELVEVLAPYFGIKPENEN